MSSAACPFLCLFASMVLKRGTVKEKGESHHSNEQAASRAMQPSRHLREYTVYVAKSDQEQTAETEEGAVITALIPRGSLGIAYQLRVQKQSLWLLMRKAVKNKANYFSEYTSKESTLGDEKKNTVYINVQICTHTYILNNYNSVQS